MEQLANTSVQLNVRQSSATVESRNIVITKASNSRKGLGGTAGDGSVGIRRLEQHVKATSGVGLLVTKKSDKPATPMRESENQKVFQTSIANRTELTHSQSHDIVSTATTNATSDISDVKSRVLTATNVSIAHQNSVAKEHRPKCSLVRIIFIC